MSETREKRPLVPKPILWVTVLSAAFYGLLRLPYAFGLRFVTGLPDFLSGMLLALSLIALFTALLIRLKKHILLRCLCALLIAGILSVSGFVLYMFPLFGTTPSEIRVEASPSGKHRLVIIENGFIDAAYSAYPMVNDWMYRAEDNGWISLHDFWGDVSDPSVEWLSDAEARVTLGFAFYPNPGSADEIVVRFQPD